MRGEVFTLTGTDRWVLVVQSTDVTLPSVLVAPLSAKAQPASWRPLITVEATTTQALCDQITAVTVDQLTDSVAILAPTDMLAVDKALKIITGLL